MGELKPGIDLARVLAARNDHREEVADPQARYYGIEVGETTLIQSDDARLGETRLDDWLRTM